MISPITIRRTWICLLAATLAIGCGQNSKIEDAKTPARPVVAASSDHDAQAKIHRIEVRQQDLLPAHADAGAKLAENTVKAHIEAKRTPLAIGDWFRIAGLTLTLDRAEWRPIKTGDGIHQPNETQALVVTFKVANDHDSRAYRVDVTGIGMDNSDNALVFDDDLIFGVDSSADIPPGKTQEVAVAFSRRDPTMKSLSATFNFAVGDHRAICAVELPIGEIAGYPGKK